MKSYILLVLCLIPLLVTHAQFSTCDIRGTTPTLPCNYCTLSPTITIGANTTYPPSPQTVNVADYSTTARFGRFANSTGISNGPTAGPLTLGRTVPSGAPSNSGSNLVQMRGLYHYFYSAGCVGNGASSAAVLVCDQQVATNAASGPGVTSGYDTTNERWYPPEVGHYLVSVSGLGCKTISVTTELYINSQRTSIGGASNAIATLAANACTANNNFQSISISVIITFNNVGSGDYIFVQGSNMDDSGGSPFYTKLVITRVA